MSQTRFRMSVTCLDTLKTQMYIFSAVPSREFQIITQNTNAADPIAQMKSHGAPIARTELLGIRRDGAVLALIAEISQPYETPDGSWRTQVALHGLDARPSEVSGDDSLQSLSRAVEMVHRRLADFVEAGDRLVDQEGVDFLLGNDFPEEPESAAVPMPPAYSPRLRQEMPRHPSSLLSGLFR